MKNEDDRLRRFSAGASHRAVSRLRPCISSTRDDIVDARRRARLFDQRAILSPQRNLRKRGRQARHFGARRLISDRAWAGGRRDAVHRAVMIPAGARWRLRAKCIVVFTLDKDADFHFLHAIAAEATTGRRASSHLLAAPMGV